MLSIYNPQVLDTCVLVCVAVACYLDRARNNIR